MSEQRTITLPLPESSAWAKLETPVPLTEIQWEYLINLLLAMKPGLVRIEAAAGADETATAS